MWIVPSLLADLGFIAAFTTREHHPSSSSSPFASLGAGHSDGIYASWNFSTSTGDTAANVQANYNAITTSLNLPPDAIKTVHQVHSARIVEVKTVAQATSREQADGVLCLGSGLIAAVKTADCVPVLIADPKSGFVAAVHAGWRGLLAGIVPQAIRQLRKHAPKAEPRVAIGPHISAASFQVGPEVAEAFPPTRSISDPSAPGRFLSDMQETLCDQLRELQIPEAHIQRTRDCTLHDAQKRFFSHRGHQGRCGRQLSFVCSRPAFTNEGS